MNQRNVHLTKVNYYPGQLVTATGWFEKPDKLLPAGILHRVIVD